VALGRENSTFVVRGTQEAGTLTSAL
jgi:hypothetical protein